MSEVGPWGRARTFVNADTLGLVIVSLFKISNYCFVFPGPWASCGIPLRYIAPKPYY